MTERLDVALVSRGLAPSREKAKASIAGGFVYVNERNDVKASYQVGPDDVVEVRGVAIRYVGRGGIKLEKALRVFGIDVTGCGCVDLGASTGGFTDCLLQAGATQVHAIDVGHGQLDPSLVQDERVISLEGTDARTVTAAMVGGPVPFVCADVSFISLEKVLPVVADLLLPTGKAVCLVKPQFEAGPEHVGKRGVVKDPGVHTFVLDRVMHDARAVGLTCAGLEFSPITGPEGNIEYLLYLTKEPAEASVDVRAVVERAHKELRRN